MTASSENRMKQHVSKSLSSWMLKLVVHNTNCSTLKDPKP